MVSPPQVTLEDQVEGESVLSATFVDSSPAEYRHVGLNYSSKIPDGAPRFYQRLDPIHEMAWEDMIGVKWEVISSEKNALTLDETGHLVHRMSYAFSPVMLSEADLYDHEVITAMSVVTEWSQITGSQIAAVLGTSTQRAEAIMLKCYTAGLVARLTPPWLDEDNDAKTACGHVWRPLRNAWSFESFWKGVDSTSWVLGLNGYDPTVGMPGANAPSSFRHNVASFETALKAMECCPSVVGAWGEKRCVGTDFFDARSVSGSEEIRANIGDGMIVTKGGRLIILETAGTSGAMAADGNNQIVQKAAMWTSVIARSKFDIAVVFLDISRRSSPAWLRRYAAVGVESLSKSYLVSDKARKEAAEKVFVVDSREWFPVARGVSESFLDMTAWCVADRKRRPIIDEPMDAAVTDTHVVNTVAALATPPWVGKTPLSPAQRAQAAQESA